MPASPGRRNWWLNTVLQEDHDVSPKRHVLVANLDDRSRSAVEECFSSEHPATAVLDADAEPAVSGAVDLVVLGVADDTEPTRELCQTIRSRVGPDVPLVACAVRYVYPLIRPLLGSDVQSLLITPFDAGELREKVDELDLGF
jgi:hypothetical protein